MLHLFLSVCLSVCLFVDGMHILMRWCFVCVLCVCMCVEKVNKKALLFINSWVLVAEEVVVARGGGSSVTSLPLALPFDEVAATVGTAVTWAVMGTGEDDDGGSAVVFVVVVVVGIGSVQSRTLPGYLCRPSNTPSCP